MVKRIQETRLAPKAAPLSHPIVALLESSYGTVSQGRTEEGYHIEENLMSAFGQQISYVTLD